MSSLLPKQIFCALLLTLTHVACGDSDTKNQGDSGMGSEIDGGGVMKDAGRESDAIMPDGNDAATVDAALPAGDVTFTKLYEEVFSDSLSCSSFYCHAGGGQGVMMTGLNTSAKDALYDLLVNKDASNNCAGWKRVVPGDPDKSLLVKKLGASPPCGVRMPKDMAALSATQVAQIRSWILDGAKNN